MATVNFKGLLGITGSVTVTLSTTTIDQLITAIASAEGLPTDFYHLSLLTDHSKNDVTYGDSTTKLSAIGFTDGCTVLCTPDQSGSRERRQIQKLEIARVKRAAAGDTTKPYYRAAHTYDINKLPTKYSVNTLVDNPNIGGLLNGRPWS
jgi:transglutaminase-like putative cysteine protease